MSRLNIVLNAHLRDTTTIQDLSINVLPLIMESSGKSSQS
jgi:hypothetical protein